MSYQYGQWIFRQYYSVHNLMLVPCTTKQSTNYTISPFIICKPKMGIATVGTKLTATYQVVCLQHKHFSKVLQESPQIEMLIVCVDTKTGTQQYPICILICHLNTTLQLSKNTLFPDTHKWNVTVCTPQ